MRMTSCRRIGLWTVVLAGVSVIGSRASAQVLPATPPSVTPPPVTTPGLDGVVDSDGALPPGALPVPPAAIETPSVFPYTPYADHPHPGDPLAPSVGQPHYDAPFWRYNHWFRPKAATLTAWQRCLCPDPFRPRGFGNLFARPCSPYRMEYDPYVIEDARNQYGPSYFVRPPDQRCWCAAPRHR